VVHDRLHRELGLTSDARLLGEPRSAPLLTMQRISYDDSGRVAEFADHAYRPQIYSFEITLVNRY
jgi:DNA-binding GntR family transcriptional regulator